VTPRRRRIFLAVALAVVALPAAAVARFTLFAPTFDVPSIALAPEYQDAALLARAWALPAAATYGGTIDYQSNGSVCGPTSLANAFRSLHEPAATVDAVLAGSGRCWTGACIFGLTLDELAEVARAKTGRTVSVLRDLTAEQFRAELLRANDPARRYVINFHRGLLFGKGVGHHSPIGGYLEDRDLVFVLDVNEKFRPWLVARARLFAAMDSVDSSSGRKRGLLLIE